MKTAKYILGAVVVFMAACTGYTEPDTTIQANVLEMIADGSDAVHFAVRFQNEDVTALAAIRNVATGETLSGNTFTTTTPGTYRFTAVYQSIESLVPVTIVAHEAKLVLQADPRPEGDDYIFTFLARYGTVDVSLDEGLKVIEEGSAQELVRDTTDDYFRTTTTGDERRRYYATWGEETSEAVAVGPVRPYKRVGTLEFTGTWCKFCPNMVTYLKGVETTYPDRNVVVAVHENDKLTVDPFALELGTRFGVSAMPAVVLDFGNPLVTPNPIGSSAALVDRLRTIVEENPANCAIAIDSSVAGGTATVTAKLQTVTASGYGIVVALVESGVTGYSQLQPDGETWVADYVHDHVLRAVDGASIEGTATGAIAAGEEATHNVTFDLTGYDPANCHIVVFATTGTGDALRLVNAAECPLGESVDYRYETIE